MSHGTPVPSTHIANPSDRLCPFCSRLYTATGRPGIHGTEEAGTQLTCGHIFGAQCFGHWLATTSNMKRWSQCPTCNLASARAAMFQANALRRPSHDAMDSVTPTGPQLLPGIGAAPSDPGRWFARGGGGRGNGRRNGAFAPRQSSYDSMEGVARTGFNGPLSYGGVLEEIDPNRTYAGFGGVVHGNRGFSPDAMDVDSTGPAPLSGGFTGPAAQSGFAARPAPQNRRATGPAPPAGRVFARPRGGFGSRYPHQTITSSPVLQAALPKRLSLSAGRSALQAISDATVRLPEKHSLPWSPVHWRTNKVVRFYVS
ncbi:uncharacterized protein BDZ99DRAFT_475793 [Mytilinidion resinicola]|uniref:RING-type domain-containing protein n=1 Tax=Mytilinidion resinicola TaxID=574789 RepID=A0A6A6YSA0_9PEZI|nr:uncharacterized protein BDZ99DRAFT_475793 [Mytilinidion resinicola]KAF2810924.1 hypothetical protein BDZ99DRAFT_475793 [Mytilinidion resinicola]